MRSTNMSMVEIEETLNKCRKTKEPTLKIPQISWEIWEITRVLLHPLGPPRHLSSLRRITECLKKADRRACGDSGAIAILIFKGTRNIGNSEPKHWSHILSWKMEANVILRESTLLVIYEHSRSFLQNMRPVILLQFSSHWTDIWYVFEFLIIC